MIARLQHVDAIGSKSAQHNQLWRLSCHETKPDGQTRSNICRDASGNPSSSWRQRRNTSVTASILPSSSMRQASPPRQQARPRLCSAHPGPDGGQGDPTRGVIKPINTAVEGPVHTRGHTRACQFQLSRNSPSNDRKPHGGIAYAARFAMLGGEGRGGRTHLPLVLLHDARQLASVLHFFRDAFAVLLQKPAALRCYLLGHLNGANRSVRNIIDVPRTSMVLGVYSAAAKSQRQMDEYLVLELCAPPP